MEYDSDFGPDDDGEGTDQRAIAHAFSEAAPDQAVDPGPVAVDHGRTVVDHGRTVVDHVEAPAYGEAVADGEAAADEIDLELLDAIEQELADVELALDRLGDGTYGRCETCGQAFTEDELENAPAGRYCRAHLPLVLP